MKKSITLTFALLSITSMTFAQLGDRYNELVATAWKHYQNKAYLESAQTYSKAFASVGDVGLITDRYNAACSWARANEPDSAFVQLFRIARSGYYTNYRHMSIDSDLLALHKDPRWSEVTALVKINQEKEEANYDKTLVAMLDTIYQEDQNLRMQIEDIQKKSGYDSEEMREHWKKIMTADSINLIKVRKILDERGWLGDSIIGEQGNQTLFLVIQHSDLKTQEQYLPMMREAVKDGNADPGSLALLEDRVALQQGKRQTYGSQIGQNDNGEYYVMPLEDPDNVDKRRAEVGLEPLQNYLANWNLTWDVEAYKKKLPEIEAKK
jgi:hypothetical protein